MEPFGQDLSNIAVTFLSNSLGLFSGLNLSVLFPALSLNSDSARHAPNAEKILLLLPTIVFCK